MNDIYSSCPTYKTELITLRQTNIDDAEELLKCYSDKKAVQLFNSDNCHGDNFYYTTIERMKEAINFWDFSYKHKYFVRWTIIVNETNEKIGTVEMFHRIAEDIYNHVGVLRIDLQSMYETKSIISEILHLADEHFFTNFKVDSIITKAIPIARERISSLIQNSYHPTDFIYDHYYRKTIKQ